VTTTFFLVRHAIHDRVGTILCGRMPGVILGSTGQAQAHRLGERFAREKITCLLSSPLERAIETAEPIASRIGQPITCCEAINEVDFGDWTGKSFESLAQDPLWFPWNNARSNARPPGGETMLEAQSRIVQAMDRSRRVYPDQSIILVSHSDVIKAALLYHLGLSLDAYSRIEISPASVSTLAIGDWGSKVLSLNEVVAA
jgi:probable phosphoglycerate mutase